MTRKDYVLLAEALRGAFPVGDVPPAVVWGYCVRYVADALAAENPRFDRERFLDACRGADAGLPGRYAR